MDSFGGARHLHPWDWFGISTLYAATAAVKERRASANPSILADEKGS